jgi:hypothetical protein
MVPVVDETGLILTNNSVISRRVLVNVGGDLLTATPITGSLRNRRTLYGTSAYKPLLQYRG